MILALLALAGSLACVPSPKQNYTLEQIGKLDSLEELMRVSAQSADPLFKKRAQASYTEAEFQAMLQGGGRVEAAATALALRVGKSRPKAFGELAMKLKNGSAELLAAAQARSAQRASAALEAMKSTCASCHKQFK
jgi:cytochrome c556